MSKLNPESKTGFPWSLFVGKKKKKKKLDYPLRHKLLKTFQQVLTQ